MAGSATHREMKNGQNRTPETGLRKPDPGLPDRFGHGHGHGLDGTRDR